MSQPGRLEPLIRPAIGDDVAKIDTMLEAHDAASDAPRPRPGARAIRLRQLLHHGEVFVAEIDGRVVGFGGTVDTGRAVHLTDLFIDYEFLGRGIGGRLLPLLYHDRWPRTTFASNDPRAIPLYIRAGMTAYWPNLYVSADEASLPKAAPGFDAELASAAQLATIEAEWTSVDRSADHEIWANREGARPLIVRRGPSIVAIVQSRARTRGDGRWIDRLLVAPTADIAESAVAAMRLAVAPGRAIGACIPGPNPALGALVNSGVQIIDRDTFMASEPDLVDPIRAFVDTSAP